MSTLENMKTTLKKYLKQYNDLVNKNTILENQVNAQKQEFISERQAGKKGQLSSRLLFLFI